MQAVDGIYPLFRGAHPVTLRKDWRVRLPETWRPAFLETRAGIIGPDVDGDDRLNIFSSAESYSFHARETKRPCAIFAVSPDGYLTVPRELRNGGLTRGECLFLGQGMWVQLWNMDAFRTELERTAIPLVDNDLDELLAGLDL